MITAWKGRKCKQKRVPQPLYHPIGNFILYTILLYKLFIYLWVMIAGKELVVQRGNRKIVAKAKGALVQQNLVITPNILMLTNI